MRDTIFSILAGIVFGLAVIGGVQYGKLQLEIIELNRVLNIKVRDLNECDLQHRETFRMNDLLRERVYQLTNNK